MSKSAPSTSDRTTAADSVTAVTRSETGQPADRLAVLKTYKLYIGGAFARTESGRTERIDDGGGKPLAHICRASRKDFRDAVTAARAAQPGWAGRSAYNRAQVLYRIGEMLEGRATQFREELEVQGLPSEDARREVELSVDRLVYYAGWADKVQQVFSSVNPVASSHFNFSILEATGVVGLIAPPRFGLLGLISLIAPAIVTGNTCVALASGKQPLSAITFGEVLNSSDVPGGVVNLLTGRRSELLEHFAMHRDVNALVLAELDSEQRTAVRTLAAENVKRIIDRSLLDWTAAECESPYWILDTTEVKTTWHPIGV